MSHATIRPLLPSPWRLRYRVRCKNTGATATVFSHAKAPSKWLVKGPGPHDFADAFRSSRAFELAQAAVAPRTALGVL